MCMNNMEKLSTNELNNPCMEELACFCKRKAQKIKINCRCPGAFWSGVGEILTQRTEIAADLYVYTDCRLGF